MSRYNDKKKITKHYDLVSPYYHSLWGEHLHHGYWVTGNETKEEAQLALTKYLAKVAGIKQGDRIVDVGCGFGASSIFLAKAYKAKTVGITISSTQVKMAIEAAAKAKVDSEFLLMDAEKMIFVRPFDVIWSIESISHYTNKKKFFANAVKFLKPNGTVAVIDWFKKDNISIPRYKKYIEPIEKGMMVKLHTMESYVSILQSSGLEIIRQEDISRNTAKTWDVSINIIKDRAFWNLALKNGKEFVDFLRAFRAVKKGFASGDFVYGMIVARKTTES